MRTSLVARVNLVSYSRLKTHLRGTRMFHSGVLFLSAMVSWSVCTRPGTDLCNLTITCGKTMLLLITFAAITAEVNRWELLTEALHVTALGRALCLVQGGGKVHRQTGIPTGILSAVATYGCFETICLPPNFSLQTDQHIGSMDFCGLEPLWEIQSNSINTSSHYTLLPTVLKELKKNFIFQNSVYRYLWLGT